MKEVRVAIIGFGGIARAHLAGYRILAEQGAPVRLVALCDVDEKRFKEEVKINIDTDNTAPALALHTYCDVAELLANEEFDMADICLPTYLHKEYAIRLLRAGKHVLSEKPMALSYADCCEMLAAAKETGCRLMIGQCLRFNAFYSFLKECVEDKRYGKLTRLSMERLSALPTWGYEDWFRDTERSGGCILDMHIHDVDMARYLLGEPNAVSAVTLDGTVRWQYESSRLFYDDCTVFIEGSWDEVAGVPFRASYRARFEKAEIVFEKGNALTVYTPDAAPMTPTILATNHMAEEIAFLANLILNPDAVNEKNPPESAATTVRLIESLRESAAQNGATVTLS